MRKDRRNKIGTISRQVLLLDERAYQGGRPQGSRRFVLFPSFPNTTLTSWTTPEGILRFFLGYQKTSLIDTRIGKEAPKFNNPKENTSNSEAPPLDRSHLIINGLSAARTRKHGKSSMPSNPFRNEPLNRSAFRIGVLWIGIMSLNVTPDLCLPCDQ